jgi:hypothetical protein
VDEPDRYEGVFSYTRTKDQFNAVSQLAKYLEMELKIRAPGSELFHDITSIVEGQHFPEVLTDQSRRSDVFLPLISPAWLASNWCRREYLTFTSDLTDSQRLHRVLPVLWVATPQLETDAEDALIAALKPVQRFDWSELRYGDWNSPENRREVGRLADRIVALAADGLPEDSGHKASTGRIT